MEANKKKNINARKDALLSSRTMAQLIEIWEISESMKISADLAVLRGWVMDELAKRDPLRFDAWIDGAYGDDSKSARRAFIGIR